MIITDLQWSSHINSPYPNQNNNKKNSKQKIIHAKPDNISAMIYDIKKKSFLSCCLLKIKNGKTVLAYQLNK